MTTMRFQPIIVPSPSASATETFNYVTTHQINEGTYPSLAALIRDIAK